jgi:hypothetical protein
MTRLVLEVSEPVEERPGHRYDVLANFPMD